MKKEVIFCVDDEKIVLNSLKSELKNAFGDKYIIETAESGIEALEEIENLLNLDYQVPIVIVDYAMPIMKGDELLEKIHKLSPDTLKILLTGQATVEGVTNSINKANLYRYIAKPWNTEDLILTIQQALKSYHQEDQLKNQNKELLALSNSLEKKVETRTLELQNNNALLLKKQNEITNQKEELEKYRFHLEELVESRTKELIISKEKAEESDRLKSAFLANMSHEIRTPMNGILGFSELLKNPEISNEKQQKFIDIIFKSGQRLLSTLNDLMDISKLETGLVKLNISRININEEVENIYSHFKLEALNKGLFFNLAIPENNEIIIETDREKLFGVLSNLIKNAIKYTKTGGINFGYTVNKNTICFYVKDTGIGIPQNRLEAIFDRFVQADIEDKKVYEGCGLGLSIAKSYADMFNGKIIVESEEGQGSIFNFEIPFVNLNNNVIIDDNSELTNKNSENSSDIKILIVEDEEFALIYLSQILKDICAKMVFTKNGKEAIEIFKANPDIDLILMDIKMPIMGGYEATAQIREFNKEIIIIAQTAYAMLDDSEKALNSGFNDYVSKPINKDVLISKIFNNLNKKLIEY